MVAGTKRPRQSTEADDTGDAAAKGPPSSSPYLPMFQHFRRELDEHHERRERVIKASRDITALSKKMVFSLQRVRQFNDVLPQDVAAELSTRKQEILKTFESISADTTGINRWRYERQISGGVQEFIEALSFEHYLTRQTLVTPDEASQALAGHIPLTADDYVLGIFDLVGELMRFCITQIATSGELPKLPEPRSVLTDLRALRAYFEMLNTRNASAGGFLAKDVDKKMEVMKTSVEKVEHATYGIILRGRERPKGWVPPMESDMGNALSGETYA